MKKVSFTYLVVAPFVFGSVANAQVHTPSTPSLTACANAVQFMKISYTIPLGTADIRNQFLPAKPVTNSCQDYTWIESFDRKNNIIFWANYGGPNITTSAWDCQHSAILYGLYKQSNTTSVYNIVSSTMIFGRLNTATNVCEHPFSVPAGEVQPTGPQFQVSSNPEPRRFRMAVMSWQHNDADFGHTVVPGCTGPACQWSSSFSMSRN